MASTRLCEQREDGDRKAYEYGRERTRGVTRLSRRGRGEWCDGRRRTRRLDMRRTTVGRERERKERERNRKRKEIPVYKSAVCCTECDSGKDNEGCTSFSCERE